MPKYAIVARKAKTVIKVLEIIAADPIQAPLTSKKREPQTIVVAVPNITRPMNGNIIAADSTLT